MLHILLTLLFIGCTYVAYLIGNRRRAEETAERLEKIDAITGRIDELIEEIRASVEPAPVATPLVASPIFKDTRQLHGVFHEGYGKWEASLLTKSQWLYTAMGDTWEEAVANAKASKPYAMGKDAPMPCEVPRVARGPEPKGAA